MCMTIEKKSTNDENPKTLITGKCNHIRTFRKSLIDGGFVHNVQMIIGEGVASIVRKIVIKITTTNAQQMSTHPTRK